VEKRHWNHQEINASNCGADVATQRTVIWCHFLSYKIAIILNAVTIRFSLNSPLCVYTSVACTLVWKTNILLLCARRCNCLRCWGRGSALTLFVFTLHQQWEMFLATVIILAKLQIATVLLSVIDWHKSSHIPQNAELHSTCHFFVKISAQQKPNCFSKQLGYYSCV